MNLLRMSNNIVMYEKKKKQIHPFQVKHRLTPGLNTNMAFIEQVESNMDLTFSSKNMMDIRRVLRKENTRVLSIMIL